MIVSDKHYHPSLVVSTLQYTREVTKSHELPSGRYVKKGQTVVMSAYVQVCIDFLLD
jgi:hypothetical protein